MPTRLLVVACLALLLVVPASASPPRPSTTAPEPATLPAPSGLSFRSYANEFTLALPVGWKVLPKSHPVVASLAKGEFSNGFELEFVAYDPTGVRAGYATDCIILKGVGRGNAPLSTWVAAQVAGLKSSLQGAPFTKQLVHLPGGWALRVSYRIVPDGTKSVWALTYLFDEVSSSYALSCSTATVLRDRYLPVFDATANTFLVTG
jgi:hypothetical protein